MQNRHRCILHNEHYLLLRKLQQYLKTLGIFSSNERRKRQHRYKIGRSEWKRTGSSFHAIFQNDTKQEVSTKYKTGVLHKEKCWRYFA
jgi:hypothetical protein